MTTHWMGAQWVLATWLVIFTVLPTVLRIGLIKTGGKPKEDWSSFWASQISCFIRRASLVAVMAWGGFWS